MLLLASLSVADFQPSTAEDEGDGRFTKIYVNRNENSADPQLYIVIGRLVSVSAVEETTKVFGAAFMIVRCR